MEQIPAGKVERTMKVQEVILRAMAKKITWWQAAEILGISGRCVAGSRVRGSERVNFLPPGTYVELLELTPRQMSYPWSARKLLLVI